MGPRPEWSDTNVHDPGITVLELLMYTLDDLRHAVRDRVRRSPCGWPCALAIVAGTASVVFLLAARRRRP